ncbi:hydrolase [Aliidiomarina sp.]|uniref:hydrolase n=1 Tax=Aliidiomarina sp. TaxID=1872439 RepID=UPI003A4E4ADF
MSTFAHQRHTISRDHSVLLTIDIQGRLAPAIHAADDLIAAADKLLQVAAELQVPRVFTEQYPQGIGTTVAALQTHLAQATLFEKIHFSACRESDFSSHIADSGRQQLVVMGTEAHVCVLQTVLDLLAADYQVFVVAEAVGSRHPANRELALQRMAALGAHIVSVEMVIFEWLEQAGTDTFRHISKTYIR